MRTPSECRRNAHQRAQVLKQVVNRLRCTTSCSIQALAYAAGDVPELTVRRLLRRFAARGLVRNETNGHWAATGALKSDADVATCSVDY